MKPDPTPTAVSSFASADSSESTTESKHSSVPGQKEDLPIDHVSEVVNPEQMARDFFLGSAQQPVAGRRRRDYRTGALTAAVIVLSLLLGWMVGRAGWNMAINHAQNQSPEVSEEALAASQYSPPAPPRTEALSNLAATTRATPTAPPMSSSVPKSPKSKIESIQHEGALVMYEGGKVIFRATPSQVTSPSAKKVGAAQTAVPRKTDSPPRPDQTLLAATNAHVLTRVVPQYPDDARQQGVQGSVVLNALVGSDGTVQQVKVISGNPQLVQAAANAVRQWRFQPHLSKGKPAEFETRITVNFSLP